MRRAWVVVAVVILAACNSTPTASTPSPTPSASAVTEEYGAPPAGVPLIYVPDPRHAGWYIGVDWTGKPRATIKLTSPLESNQQLLQAPDGSAFVIPAFKGLSGAFLDRLGNPIADPDAQGHAWFMWADDSKQLCTLDFTGGLKGKWVIGLKTPGAREVVHSVTLDPNIISSGIIAIAFRSCSPANNRAVLVYNYMDRPSQLYVVRLSDGAVLLHQTHSPNVLADITASTDSKLVAEDSGQSIGYLMGPTAPATRVWGVRDGAIVAKLDPAYFVEAFSRDDSLALVSTSPVAPGVPTNLALVRLSDGRVLWHLAGGPDYGGSWVRPDGNDIAFQLALGSGGVEIVIVHPDGTATSTRMQ